MLSTPIINPPQSAILGVHATKDRPVAENGQVAVDMVAPHLTRGELVRVLAPWITGRLSMYAAVPSRKFMPQRTRVFLDFLVAQTRLKTAEAMQACAATA